MQFTLTHREYQENKEMSKPNQLSGTVLVAGGWSLAPVSLRFPGDILIPKNSILLTLGSYSWGLVVFIPVYFLVWDHLTRTTDRVLFVCLLLVPLSLPYALQGILHYCTTSSSPCLNRHQYRLCTWCYSKYVNAHGSNTLIVPSATRSNGLEKCFAVHSGCWQRAMFRLGPTNPIFLFVNS